MARPRKKTFTMSQYTENVNDGYISNNFKTQRFPKWKPIVDGLAVTILNDDYIAPIILAENEDGQTQIVDGGSRTAAYMMIKYGNYKIKSSVEDPIIEYKSMSKDENGKVTWTDATFDIRNKTYSQFPKELQKAFDEYQVETVIHECNSETVAKYLRRYNIHTAMNANERMFIHLPSMASEVREITNRQFFINHSNFTDSEKEKGMLERVVSESVMCMFHLDKWNKNGKNIASYLNENSSKDEFEKLNANIGRLENIITDDIKDIFNSKDSFIWLTAFNQFLDLGVEDIKFAEFLQSFKNGLRNKEVNGKLFDTVDNTGSTKDKAIIKAKLEILTALIYDFLHINEEDLKDVDDIVTFVQECVGSDITEDDVDLYCDMMADYLEEVNNPKLAENHNIPSIVAMIAYGCKRDIDVQDWFINLFDNTDTYLKCQRANFLHMKTECDMRYKLNRVS